MHKLSENVFYDSASAIQWSDLNETTFLERVLARLNGLMGEAFFRYTFFVLSSQNGSVIPDSSSDPSPRKVLIFISDESSSLPAHLASHYLAIFKAYLPRELPGTNIFPFNLGYVRDVPTYPFTPVEERGISVFFSGNLNLDRLGLYRVLHPIYRQLPPAAFRVAQSLSARGLSRWMMPRDLSHALPSADVHFTDGFKKGLSPAEYGRRLADSRIVLCPRGWYSAETFRHVEAMRAGAIVVSEPLPQTHLYRDAPVLTVSDWEIGLHAVKELLEDEPALRQVQGDTVRWWKEVFSEGATAKYMHRKIMENPARD
jgi:hypothetical protein